MNGEPFSSHPGALITIDIESQTTSSTLDVMRHGTTPGQTVSISPDGELVAVTGFIGGRARVYATMDLESGHQTVVPAEALGTKDSACVFSSDGKRLFVGNDDGWVRVFDVATLGELVDDRWQAHSTEVTAMAMAGTEDVLATAGGNTTILWSTEKKDGVPRRQRLRLPTGPNSRNWIQFCADDTLLLHCAPDSPIEVWEAPKSP